MGWNFMIRNTSHHSAEDQHANVIRLGIVVVCSFRGVESRCAFQEIRILAVEDTLIAPGEADNCIAAGCEEDDFGDIEDKCETVIWC